MSSSGNAWVQTWRKVYHPLGFKHGYNFPLFIILCGALMGFVLARLQYLNIDGIFIKSAIPSDAALYQRPGYKRVGIILHLAGILPAGFLVVFQFVPVIRYKALLFHRMNGYIIISLFLVSVAGAFMVVPSSAGGNPATQSSTGFLGAITTISIALAYYNIKRLRIDLHREWMIRTWVYAGSVITQRLIMLAAQRAIYNSSSRSWSAVQTCASIEAQYALFGVPPQSNLTQKLYPGCVDPTASVVVNAKGQRQQGPENISTFIALNFGMAMWLAIAIHAIGVEVYFRFTQAESERLRQVSIERRAEHGTVNRKDVDRLESDST